MAEAPLIGRTLAHYRITAAIGAAYPSLAQRKLISQTAESPRFSRAANELFYIEAGRLKALVYEVRGEAFRPAATTTLFELGRLTTQYDVADGRRFLFLARSPGTSDRD